METIEERADEYASREWYALNEEFNEDHTTFENIVSAAFVAGAKSEREELTKWNDPFVKDMPKDNVLVKYIAVGCPNNPYYTIGRREPSGWWDCENTLATSQPRFEIVGWRPIHE